MEAAWQPTGTSAPLVSEVACPSLNNRIAPPGFERAVHSANIKETERQNETLPRCGIYQHRLQRMEISGGFQSSNDLLPAGCGTGYATQR